MKKFSKIVFRVFGCLLFAGMPRLYAQEQPDAVSRTAWQTALARIPEVTRAAYPESDAVTIYAWDDTRYEADGAYVRDGLHLIKVLSPRGVERLRTISFWNNDFYGRFDVVRAQIHGTNGLIRAVDLKNCLSEAVSTADLGSNIRDPNDKNITLALPGLMPGETIELATRRTTKARAKGIFSAYETFEDDGAVLWQGVSFNGPESRPLQSRMLRAAESLEIRHFCVTNAPSAGEKEGRITESWIVENVPRFYEEPSMPRPYTCVARLLVSTAADWKTVSRWYAQLCGPHLSAVTPAMEAKVKELLRGCGTRDEKIRALFDFVSREVRYMGVMAEKEAPGYEPHDAALTFENRYGVCRDKAALLVSLYRIAGIRAWPVLIMAGPQLDENVPQPFFNHAIVAVEAQEAAQKPQPPDETVEPYLLMDPTNESTLNLLPEYLCEKSYLVARDEGDFLRVTPPLQAEKNMIRAETRLDLGGTESVTGESRILFLGINDVSYRGYFAEMGPRLIAQWCARIVAYCSPGAVLTDWELTPAPEQLRTSREPLQLHIRFSFPSPFRKSAENAEPSGKDFTAVPFEAPFFASYIAPAERMLSDELGLETRRFPFETGVPCGAADEITFLLPPGASLRGPEKTKLEQDGVFFEEDFRKGETEQHRIHARKMLLRKGLYAADAYGSLKALLVQIQEAKRRFVLLEAGASGNTPENAVASRAAAFWEQQLARSVQIPQEDHLFLEEKDITIDLRGLPESWTQTERVSTKVCSYAGQREAGDLAFLYFPAEENVTVLHARTLLPSGKVVAWNPELEVFEGDQSWVDKAPRYPAGRIQTLSFPSIEPGCVLEYTLQRKHFQKPFSFSLPLGTKESFAKIRCTVLSDDEDTLSGISFVAPEYTGMGNDWDVTESREPGKRIWEVQGGGTNHALALSARNAPCPEAYLPRLTVCIQTPEEAAAKIVSRMEECSDPREQKQAAETARRLTENLRTTAEKVRAIREWSYRKMRTAGPGYASLSLSFLSAADTTLAAGYGHSMDLRILELAMLRAIGIEPEVRLYASEWTGLTPEQAKARFSVGRCLDGVSLCIRTPEGETFFLEGASPFAALTESRFFSKQGLQVIRSGMDSDAKRISYLLDTPAGVDEKTGSSALEESRDNALEASYEVALQKDGSARVHARFERRGVLQEAFQKKVEEFVPEERIRFIRQRCAEIAQNARLLTPVDEVLKKDAQGLWSESMTVEIPRLFAPVGDVQAGRFPGNVPKLSPIYAPRKDPFLRNGSFVFRSTWKLVPPEGFELVRLPGNFETPPDAASFGIRYRRKTEMNDDGTAEMRIFCAGVDCEFSPALYADFLKLCFPTQGVGSEAFLLKAKGAGESL